MVISDKYKFVFVHIPKCAGTTIRSQIQRFDDYNGFFRNKIDNHPDYGLLNYVHIPLILLEQLFHKEYVKVESYNSFAIVRDPYKRFVSSAFYYINRNSKGINKMTKRQIRSEIYKIIDYLYKHINDEILHANYIHFQRQNDFIFNNNKQIIKSLFIVDDLEKIYTYINGLIDDHEIFLNKERKLNKNMVYRNNVIKYLIKVYKKYFNSRILKNIYKKHIDLFMEHNNHFLKILNDKEIVHFVNHYYKEDIALYNSLFNKYNSL